MTGWQPRATWSTWIGTTAVLAAIVAASATGCTPHNKIASPPSPTDPTPGAGGGDALESPVPPPTPETVVGGAPAVEQFVAPKTFRCLVPTPTQTPREAQITVGWSVPSATELAIALDGAALPSGIRATLPYQVPAGNAAGIGSTIVFPCDPATQHTVTISWRTRGSAPAIRVVPITKDTAP